MLGLKRFARPGPGALLFARPLAVFLLLLLPIFGPSSALAQAKAQPTFNPVPTSLYINILEGEGALNNIRDRLLREPIIQVVDANHHPVQGVKIQFTSATGETGAGATFAGLTTYETVTDAEGKAVGRGFRPNSKTGKYTIGVAAIAGIIIASILIHEDNVLADVPASLSTTTGGAIAATRPIMVATHHSRNLINSTSVVSGGGVIAALQLIDGGGAKKVPEIDPSLGLSCLVLLAGAAAVLRER